MFEITSENKIKLTIGDTASFVCTVVDNDDKVRTPVSGDVLTLYIDDLDFSEEADTSEGKYQFIIDGSETLQLPDGTYLYRVVLNTAGNSTYTIIQDAFIDLLEGRVEG